MSFARPTLRLVPDPVAPAPLVQFCGHCGEPPPTPMAARSRVCALCGLGVVIEASQDLAPDPGGSFLIVDRRLKLCGLSRGAENLLGLVEPTAVHRPITDFLEPADAEAASADALAQSIVATAGGHAPVQSIVLRPAGEYGVRYAARVGSCGSPTGALIVLDTV
ncbi:hypothetical protein FSW04_02880 [Baekduia soli]|uniref:PAS domain-containing protein n=1 Tax=Baekduia soli TaxID=496014 RepID=A0A5B8U0W0_9ACTN|nr:hypothetical protein [Baekduia soli]QEC46628.1 hypothetical protein FSW04_02880 [Baekduia soli]